jgi:hypothetical protein
MQDPQTKAKRREVLVAIAALSEQRDLPVPMNVWFGAPGWLNVRLDNNDREGVLRWSDAVQNGEVTEDLLSGSGHRPFYQVRSDRYSSDGPVWLGLDHLEIWSACDASEAGELA